jgi:hypothetical protein
MRSPFTPTRRRTLLLLAAVAPMFAPLAARGRGTKPLVEVWKDPNCGCCKDWVAHLEANGFATKVNETGNSGIRGWLGIPAKLGSCHTAQVGAYAIEGHVPAAAIRRLLEERPQAVGLAVPGMPVGSPGMDGAVYGGRRDPYDVLLVARDGTSSVFSSHR